MLKHVSHHYRRWETKAKRFSLGAREDRFVLRQSIHAGRPHAAVLRKERERLALQRPLRRGRARHLVDVKRAQLLKQGQKRAAHQASNGVSRRARDSVGHLVLRSWDPLERQQNDTVHLKVEKLNQEMRAARSLARPRLKAPKAAWLSTSISTCARRNTSGWVWQNCSMRWFSAYIPFRLIYPPANSSRALVDIVHAGNVMSLP